MTANAVVAVAKGFAALVTGSSAMFAEAVHSVADTCSEALLLLGIRRAGRRADAEHPFGHGSEVYFWGLIVAILLFGLGGAISIVEGIRALYTGERPGDPTWGYVVLAVAFVAEGVSWTIAMRKFRALSGRRPWWPSFRQSKDPTVFIPLAEDTAALIGVVVAFCGLYFAHLWDRPELDAIASIVIGVLLEAVAVFLAYESKKLLVGEAMDPELCSALERIAAEDPTVVSVDRAEGVHLGPREILLHLGLCFREDESVADLTRAIARIEREIRRQEDRIRYVFVDVRSVGRPSATA